MRSPKVTEEMARTAAGHEQAENSGPDGDVQPLTMDLVGAANDAMYDFISTNGKGLCFGLCPYWLPCCKTPEGDFAKQFKKCPEKLQVTGVVVRQGRCVGLIKMMQHGHYQSSEDAAMHKTKPGEMYIEALTVRKEGRGQGLGTALLAWGEQVARERGCTVLTLGVVKGNPAQRLYERTGFVVKEKGCVEAFAEDCAASCLLGIPHWRFGAVFMEKPLQ